MKQYVFVLLIVLVALFGAMAVSAQSGGGYDLSWWTVDGGGHTWSEGGGYSLGGTIGQPDAQPQLTGGGYTLQSGFWHAKPSGPQDPICVTKDLNLDGIIDLDDINLVIYNSIFVGAPYDIRYDLVFDGIVDIADISEVAISFGYICP